MSTHLAPKINFKDLLKKSINDQMNDWNVIDEYKYLSLDEIKDKYNKNMKPYVVCCFNVLGDINVSLILRTAAIFNVKKFILFGRSKFDKRGTVGMLNYIPFEKIKKLDDDGNIPIREFIDEMKNRNYVPIFCEQGGEILSDNLLKKSLIRNDNLIPCIIFGNESLGISKEFMENVKKEINMTEIITIPQFNGICRSYNVATAASILLWEINKIVF